MSRSAKIWRGIGAELRTSIYQPGMSGRALFEADAQEDIEQSRYDLTRVVELCESPIEELLLGALFAVSRRCGWLCLIASTSPLPITPLGRGLILLSPQVSHGKFRPDFTIYDCRAEQTKVTIIECDGHDFHERTKDQARRDRSRDRWFTMQGITVLRFTGSEIYADPFKAADEIVDWLERGDDLAVAK